MEIKIEESPYGDSGAVYDGMLGMCQHWILQLKSFRTQNKTKEERDYLEADIRGYEAILESGSQDVAIRFMEIKHTRRRELGLKDNEMIVDYMKANGLWT